jgi:hypothetical protein
MKRPWRVRRQPPPHPDAQRRGDRAYQLLTEWALATPLGTSEATGPSPAGGAQAERDLWAGRDPATSASAHGMEQPLERRHAHGEAHAAEGGDVREEHVYRDDGSSGAHGIRPGLDGLRAAVAAATLDWVLVTAPDRLARTSGPPSWRSGPAAGARSRSWSGPGARIRGPGSA